MLGRDTQQNCIYNNPQCIYNAIGDQEILNMHAKNNQRFLFQEFDPLFVSMLLPNYSTEQSNDYINKNMKWWYKKQYIVGKVSSSNIDIVKISFYHEVNAQTDFQISYRDINNVIYKITLAPIINLEPFLQGQALLSNEDDYIVSSIEIFGAKACEIARGIQFAFQSNLLRLKDIEEMIESLLFQEDNSLLVYQQIKPSL